MAKVNLTLPDLGMDNLNDSQIIRRIASYLYIQNEQLRYELTHIDEDNMSSGDSTTVQGMTQNQIQKAIEEAVRNNKDIDLSSNTIIVNLQRRLDNLGKLQAQDANNITKISQELGNKVSQTTYNSGISGLKSLIAGNTSLIGTLNQSFQTHLLEYGNHRHSIYINNSTGVISMGGPTATPSNPNISATTYFKNAVAEARANGERQGRRDWRPDRIEQSGNTVTVLNEAGDTIGGPYAINTSAAYNSGWNDCIDACNGGYYLDDYSNYNGGSRINLYRRSVNDDGDVSYSSAGYNVWRYGGSSVYRYTIPNKK